MLLMLPDQRAAQYSGFLGIIFLNQFFHSYKGYEEALGWCLIYQFLLPAIR